MSTNGAPLYVDGNDDRPLKTVTTVSTSTGAAIPATGITGLTFKLAATETGSAIDASLSKSATEIGSTGKYTAVFEGSDLITYLASYAGRVVYEIFGDASNINVVTARRVELVRRAS